MNTNTIDTIELPVLDLEAAYHAVSDTYRGADVDLHGMCAEMRRTNPVMPGDFVAEHLKVPTNAGAKAAKCVVTLFDYKNVMAIMRDAETFTNGFISEGLGAFFDGFIILAMDGEAHRKARALVHPAFMPETVNRWRPEIDRVIRKDFLEALVPNKKAELMDFGLHFPIRVLYALMGFPTDDAETYQQYNIWALCMVAGNQIDPEKIKIFGPLAQKAVKNLYTAVLEVVKKKRAAGADGDDLISRLLRAEYEGEKLDDHQVTTFVRSLLPAAGETTTRTFSSVMTMLLTRPELVERVRNDRTLIPKLIDEAVRFEPMSTFKVRQASKDVEIDGFKVKKGELVQFMTVSANRDETAIENANTFDIDRKPKITFGFGFGAHMCIGQFIAKVEIQTAVNAILDLFPNVRLDPSKPAPHITGAQMRGAKSVAVIWD